MTTNSQSGSSRPVRTPEGRDIGVEPEFLARNQHVPVSEVRDHDGSAVNQAGRLDQRFVLEHPADPAGRFLLAICVLLAEIGRSGPEQPGRLPSPSETPPGSLEVTRRIATGAEIRIEGEVLVTSQGR